jgi:hypothetical protein
MTGGGEDNKKPEDEKPNITLSGTVEKIVPSVDPREPEKAQIQVEGADPLYREIRVENTLKDNSGREVKLKKGANVDVTIEADPTGTIPKKP